MRGGRLLVVIVISGWWSNCGSGSGNGQDFDNDAQVLPR